MRILDQIGLDLIRLGQVFRGLNTMKPDDEVNIAILQQGAIEILELCKQILDHLPDQRTYT